MLLSEFTYPSKKTCTKLLSKPGGLYEKRMIVFKFMDEHKFELNLRCVHETLKITELENALEFYKYALLKGARPKEAIILIPLKKEPNFEQSLNFISKIISTISSYDQAQLIPQEYLPRQRTFEALSDKIVSTKQAGIFWDNISKWKVARYISVKTYNIIISYSKDWGAAKAIIEVMEKWNIKPNEETNTLMSNLLFKRS